MNGGMVLIGAALGGGCLYNAYKAYKGKGGIPFGAMFGGALGGLGGAMVGGALAGDSGEKEQPKPKWGAVVFWIVASILWWAVIIADFVGE